MPIERLTIRHLLEYEFRLDHNAVEAEQNINRAHGPGTVSYVTCKRHFNKFKKGDFTLEDEVHLGRPITVDDDALLQLIEEDKRRSTRDMARELGTTHTSIIRALDRLGKVYKIGRWVPHALTPEQLQYRVTTAISLLSRSRRFD